MHGLAMKNVGLAHQSLIQSPGACCWGELLVPPPAAPPGSRVDSTGSGLPVSPPSSKRGTAIRVPASLCFLLSMELRQ